MTKVRKAVIPVAGMGTRFMPITKSVPKEMLPIVNYPTIHYIVHEAVMSGIEEILFVISPSKKIVFDYFHESLELEQYLKECGKIDVLNEVSSISKRCQFSYVVQDKPLGTGNAILMAKEFVGDEAFAVLYGDDLFDDFCIPVLEQLLDIHYSYDCNVIGTLEVNESDVSKYGICKYASDSSDQIIDLVEKPSVDVAPSRCAGLGRYIFKPEIFSVLDQIEMVNGEYLLTDAMKLLMKEQPFYGCMIDGCYYDIGNHVGYVKANVAFSLKRDDLKDSILSYVQSIRNEKE